MQLLLGIAFHNQLMQPKGMPAFSDKIKDVTPSSVTNGVARVFAQPDHTVGMNFLGLLWPLKEQIKV